ncbi:hypothetical protein KC622_00970 [Candidatus Dojkabacteria bacterium]|uniref:Uncharacterized protein n=1 Tax=Candidatus Dojkabacteria bacterium TaxID=2099670 RepID=A0A955KUR2_9BACT|nr:hypothetical protein [Candidatus Dojkabacteria bacterium]MCB9790988.1 hypothetical protein [Candidatus Nomurabacteria bacterium]
MDPKRRAKIQFSTQDHLEILDISDDLVISKRGTVSIVLQTNAVNFDLLSEYEQDNKIYAFAGLLNSLNFHVQILVKTQRIDISNYLKYLKAQKERKMSEGLMKQLEIYTQFIQNLIVTNEVLDKKFYIIIPYNSVNTSISSKIGKPKDDEEVGPLSVANKAKLIEQGKIYLYPKRDHLLKQLGRMTLIGHQLTSEELMELFYNIYNPEE